MRIELTKGFSSDKTIKILKKIIAVLFILILSNVNAQYRDTLHEVFKRKSGIDARLESRFSFISNKVIGVTGFRLGVAFQRKLRVGGGLSWLRTDYKKYFYQASDTGIGKITKYLKFAYACFYVDFVFYKEKRWQLSVPIQLGGGFAWYQEKTQYNFYGTDKKYFLILYEPGITAQFKIFKWFGLGSDIAYRFSPYNKHVGLHLNSPTYSFKIHIWFDQLFYSAFPESKLSEKFGPATW